MGRLVRLVAVGRLTGARTGCVQLRNSPSPGPALQAGLRVGMCVGSRDGARDGLRVGQRVGLASPPPGVGDGRGLMRNCDLGVGRVVGRLLGAKVMPVGMAAS